MATTRQIYTNLHANSYSPPPSSSPQPSISQMHAFYTTLPSFAPTPLIYLPSLPSYLSVPNSVSIYLKAETSRLGLPSFKMLGVSWAIRGAVLQRAGWVGRNEEWTDGGEK